MVEASKPITIGTQIEASMLYPSPGISVYNPEIAIGSSESENIHTPPWKTLAYTLVVKIVHGRLFNL
jgi:hypothetical protein